MYIDGVHISVYQEMFAEHIRATEKLADESCFSGTVLVRVDVRKEDGRYEADIWTCSKSVHVKKETLHDTDGYGIVRYMNEHGICVYMNCPIISVMEDADAGSGTYVAAEPGDSAAPYKFFELLGWFTESENLWDKVCNKLKSRVSYMRAVKGMSRQQDPFCDERFGRTEEDGYKACLFYNERNWMSSYSLMIREKEQGTDPDSCMWLDFSDPVSEEIMNREELDSACDARTACGMAELLLGPEDPFLFRDCFTYSGTFASVKAMTDRIVSNGADEQWDLGYDGSGGVFRTLLKTVAGKKAG